MDSPTLDSLVEKFQQRQHEKVLRNFFVFWGQTSPATGGGFVYDGNQMTWSSVYGPNGMYPQNDDSNAQESEWWDDGDPSYGPDYNFNDGDW